MNTMTKRVRCGVGALLAVATGAMAQASGEAGAGGWSFGIAPYAWLMNVDGDIAIGDRQVDINADFEDTIKDVDKAGSLMLNAEKDSLILWLQGDFVSISESSTTPVGVRVGVDT